MALLWTILSILPDALAFGGRIFSARADPEAGVVHSYRVVGQGFDCSGTLSDAALQRCVSAAGAAQAHPADPARFVFLPVSWARTHPRADAQHWTATDRALAQSRQLGLTPVLVLHSVPEWLRARAQRWDRDNPATLSAYPQAAARFAAAVAHRYGRQVDYYQLDTFEIGRAHV